MTDGEALEAEHAQLRLAFIELGRIEREIHELEPRVRDEADHALLASLRACRRALLQMAFTRLIAAVPS